MTEKEYKQMRVSVENHKRLKALGEFGESFNDIITRLLDDQKK